MPVSSPRAILFDLGGTLLRETRIEVEAAIAWLLAAADPARFETARSRMLALYAEIRRTLRAGQTEFPMRGFLNLSLDWAGATAVHTADELELEFWKRLCSMQPLPDVGDVLAELKRQGIRAAVVSNSPFSSRVLSYELERNGLRDAFQFVISSADYGLQKPHPLIFEAALARLGCATSETWFAGDNFMKDVVGAAQVGLRPVRLSRREPPAELPPETIRIESWHEFLRCCGTSRDREAGSRMHAGNCDDETFGIRGREPYIGRSRYRYGRRIAKPAPVAFGRTGRHAGEFGHARNRQRDRPIRRI